MKLSPIVCASFVALAFTTGGALAAEKGSKEGAATMSPGSEAVAPDSAAPAADAANAGVPGRKTCDSKGMTWDSKLPNMVNATNGTITVGCHGGVTGPGTTLSGGIDCNAYLGDTICSTRLPLLCIKKDTAAFPKPASTVVPNQYYQWASGVVGTTKDVVPCRQAQTLKEANAICVAEFGPGWRVAEHHDGWGWDFQAYGGVGDHTRRFWVDITDQPNSTCWTR